jgi:hypothetical protein
MGTPSQIVEWLAVVTLRAWQAIGNVAQRAKQERFATVFCDLEGRIETVEFYCGYPA